MELDMDDPKPPYVQVADRLRAAIAAGDYPVGAKLPGIRPLAAEFGVAPDTVSKAFAVLRRESVIATRSGSGTVVRAVPTAPGPTVQEQIDDLRRRVEALESPT